MSTTWITCRAYMKQHPMHVRVDAITAMKICEADGRYAYVFIQGISEPLMVAVDMLAAIPELPRLVEETDGDEKTV